MLVMLQSSSQILDAPFYFSSRDQEFTSSGKRVDISRIVTHRRIVLGKRPIDLAGSPENCPKMTMKHTVVRIGRDKAFVDLPCVVELPLTEQLIRPIGDHVQLILRQSGSLGDRRLTAGYLPKPVGKVFIRFETTVERFSHN